MRILKHTPYALVTLLALSGCKKDKLSCGNGTSEEDGVCVIDEVPDGMGGSGSEDPDLAGVPNDRLSDARIVLAEFQGARAAAPASSTSAVVVWDLTSIADIEFNIYVSTSDDNFSFGSPQFTAPAGATSALLTSLEKNTEHFIVVRAVIAGVELPGPDEPVPVTTADDDQPPNFLGALSAETAPGAGVELAWDPIENDQTPAEVMTYLVYVGTEAGEVSLNSPYAISAPGATEMVVTMPLPETEYFFIVRARDAAGNVDDNEIEVSASSGTDDNAPRFSGCDNVAVRNASSFDVFWTPASDDIAAPDQISYNLYASTEPDGHNFAQPNDTIVGGSSGAVTGLAPDTRYYIVCRAMDPSGNEEENTRTQFDTTKDDDVPPVFGGIVAVENLSAETLDLTWNAASDNQSLPEDLVYRVYLSDSEDGHDFEVDEPWAESQPGATSVAVQDLESKTEYFIVVIAVDEAGNQSEPEPAVAVTTLVSLRNDIEIPIFATRCVTGCHGGATPEAGQNLGIGISYNSIVGVPATTYPSQDRIEPFSPETSHLYLRITTPPDGLTKMPATTDIVTADEIATIETWILQGALNN